MGVNIDDEYVQFLVMNEVLFTTCEKAPVKCQKLQSFEKFGRLSVVFLCSSMLVAGSYVLYLKCCIIIETTCVS